MIVTQRRAFLALRPLLLALAVLPAACSGTDPSVRAEERLAELPAPESEALAADVAWLADDAREGRRAGTPGELESAQWIAARMEELGIQPIGTDGYLQPFEVPLPARDGGASSVTIVEPREEGRSLSVVIGDPGRIIPLFCSAGERAEGRVVFVGYGIVAPELEWDDYADLDVEGAVVVIVRGTPPDSVLPPPEEPEEPEGSDEAGDEENPHGAAMPVQEGSRWGGYGAIFHKVMEAKRRGAVGVLVAVHPQKVEEGLLRFDAGRTAEANLPALMVQASVAEALVPGYAGLIQAIDAGDPLERSSIPARESRMQADVTRETGIAHNVLGKISGTDAMRTVVLGAHFDHLGHGGPGSLEREDIGAIHNGADDNASGTATVLEVARCLAEGSPPDGNVVFALWSGEELGLLGSEYWAENPTVSLEKVRANINLDMVGRAGDGVLQVLGAGTAEGLAEWVEAAGPRAELELEVSLSGQGVGGSDHQTFLKRDIPALHFFSGVHPDYHKPTDDADKFEADGARRVANLTLDLIACIQAPPELAYVPPAEGETPAPRGGFRTRFGSVPEYSHQGKGLLLAGTSAGGPAERAGLMKGDLILALDEIEIEGIGDFMYALNVHKPGDVVVARYVRDGEERTVRITLESNQVE